MNKWEEKWHSSNLEKSKWDTGRTYSRSTDEGYLQVVFYPKYKEMTITEHVTDDDEFIDRETYFIGSLTISDLEWIASKAKELFIGICFKGENK